jgi:putative hemolysin
LDGFIVYLVSLLALIAFSAFFSGSEAALFSLTRAQINRFEKGPGPGREVASLLQAPRRLLITILIGNLVVNVFSTSAATAVAVSTFGDKGVGIAFVFMSVIILIFGEILPKVIAIDRSERFSLFAVYPLKFFNVAFLPVAIPIVHLTDQVIEFLKKRLGAARSFFSKEELLTAFDISRHDGQVGKFEHELMSNIIEFRDTVVKEIMTPSIEVFSVPIRMSRDEIEEQMLRRDLSRVPVYGDTPDDIMGVLHIKEVAATERDGADVEIESILRTPYYVPESTRIASLFSTLASQRTQLAVVIDEYSSYVGIVTMEDILEEIVGEIRDAKEPRTTDYTLLGDRRIVVLGTMAIDRFNEVFDENISDEEHETIAGYVIGVTGRIPRAGATIEIDGLRFHIIAAEPNRIRKMRVERV